jgi:hypothetical protein
MWFLALLTLWIKVKKRKLLYQKLYPTANIAGEDIRELAYQIIKFVCLKSNLVNNI